MCGIVGYTGPREAGPILIEGLKRLEYRGYDSAGIALVDERGEMFVENLNVEADRFFAGEGVKVAADRVDLTGDTLG